MNRPLEFRAWHVPGKRIYHNVGFNEDFVFLPWDANKTETDNYKLVDHPLKRSDCILMQYTGRECEKGHKLYEGDVLRWDCVQAPEDIEEGEEEYTAYYWIKFANGSFIILNMGEEEPYHTGESDLSGYSSIHQWVGNIFENPELKELTKTYPLHPDHTPYQEVCLTHSN